MGDKTECKKKALMRRPTSTYQQQDVKKKKFFVSSSEITTPQVGGSGGAVGDKTKCKFYGKQHGNKECWKVSGKCLRCGSLDHKIKDCPRTQNTVRRAPVTTRAASVAAKPAGRPKAPARVFALTRDDAEGVEHVTEGTLSISRYYTRILFDTGATHSFISEQFSKVLHYELNLVAENLDVPLLVHTPAGTLSIS